MAGSIVAFVGLYLFFLVLVWAIVAGGTRPTSPPMPADRRARDDRTNGNR